MKGCEVETLEPPKNGMFRMKIWPGSDGSDIPGPPLEVAVESKELLVQWRDALIDARKLYENEMKIIHQESRTLNITKDISDLIVYCRSVPFELESKLHHLMYPLVRSLACFHYLVIRNYIQWTKK